MAKNRTFMVYEDGESNGTVKNLGRFAENAYVGQRITLEHNGFDIVCITKIGNKMFRCEDTGKFYVYVNAELTC